MAIVSPVPVGDAGLREYVPIEDPAAERAFAGRAGCFAAGSEAEIDAVFHVVIALQHRNVRHHLMRFLIANQRRRAGVSETCVSGGADDRRRGWNGSSVCRPGMVFQRGLLSVVGSNAC